MDCEWDPMEYTLRNPKEDVSDKHLKELTNLLKNCQSLVDSEGSGHIPIVFPSNQFTLGRVSLSDGDFQQFLNTNGHNIERLYVDTNAVDSSPINENILIDEIQNLLLHQAPNLKHLCLELSGVLPIPWKNKNRNQGDNFLHKTDPEYKEICEKASQLLKSNTSGSSLKVLDLMGNGVGYVSKVLEFIIRISPNLKEIKVDSDSPWLYSQKYLMEPENRLSLLKEFFFDFDPRDDRSSIEKMETLSFGNFKLTMFHLDLLHIRQWFQKHPYQDDQPRLVDMINRILEGSWDTLEVIHFDDVTFSKGIKLPKVMPKVTFLTIQDSETNAQAYANRNITMFPTGLNFQKTFPKLRRIEMVTSVKANDISAFSTFLNCLNFGTGLLSTSVKNVYLGAHCFIGYIGEPLPALISQRIQRWFPNASIDKHN